MSKKAYNETLPPPSSSNSTSYESGGGGVIATVTEGGGNNPSNSTRTTLATALAKAQMAVALDGAERFSEALDAYNEALGLLNSVLGRTESEESRKKLLKICSTYTNRITTLTAHMRRIADTNLGPIPVVTTISNSSASAASVVVSNNSTGTEDGRILTRSKSSHELRLYSSSTASVKTPQETQNNPLVQKSSLELLSKGSGDTISLTSSSTTPIECNVLPVNSFYANQKEVFRVPRSRSKSEGNALQRLSTPQQEIQGTSATDASVPEIRTFPDTTINAAFLHMQSPTLKIEDVSENVNGNRTQGGGWDGILYVNKPSAEDGLNVPQNQNLHHVNAFSLETDENLTDGAGKPSSPRITQRFRKKSLGSIKFSLGGDSKTLDSSTTATNNHSNATESISGKLVLKRRKRTIPDFSLFDILRDTSDEPGSSNFLFPEFLTENSDIAVFSIMRSLERSIIEGSYISTNLYIPRYVWDLKGVKLTALEVKMSQCERIRESLEKIHKISIQEMGPLLQELEDLETLLQNVRLMLAKKLSFINESSRKSLSGKVRNVMALGGLGKSAQGASKDAADLDYPDTLARLFRSAQYLETLYCFFLNRQTPQTPLISTSHNDHPYEKNEALLEMARSRSSPGFSMIAQDPRSEKIAEVIQRIAEYFQTVVCAFVLRDLGALYAVFLRRARELILE